MGEVIKMALIATYPSMAEIFLRLASGRENVVARSEYASFERAVEIAKNLVRQGEVDVILSRGGNSRTNKKCGECACCVHSHHPL